MLVNCMNVVAGSAGVSKWDGAISPVYYALYPRDEDSCNIWYFHYLFRLLPFQRSLLGLGKGILLHESSTGKLNTVRMRISMDYLNNVNLPLPPRDEQDKIVAYLNWKTSMINRMISAKKREINVAIKSMVGSSGRQRVQQSVLEELELSVPDLDEQRRIGDFLARIDEKIALNDIAITKELTDLLRKNRTIDWQKKESARAGMRRLVKRLLKKHKYPPDGMDDAVQTVMSQCEMWVDNT